MSTLEKDALTALVFKDWKPTERDKPIEHPFIKMNAEGKDKEQMKLRPLQVLKLNDSRAVLLLAAEPVIAGHSTPGVLSAYWFKRTGDSWSLDKRQEEVAMLGIFGHFADTSLHELWPGHFALAVYSNQAGGGQESQSLSLYKIDEQGVSSMVKDDALLLDMSTEGTQGCDERMQQVPGKKMRKRFNDLETQPVQCYDLKTKWSIKKGEAAPGDLLLESSARIFSNKEIGQDADRDGESYINYEFTAQARHDKQVFRYDAAKGGYQLDGRKNLLPDW
ncbi:hypothetical protein ACO0LF_23250 [Undibacterium sp. Di27W]|uniref:hypothetical protein n=1 Tax=Undibacterium sp. Di27W TaxID=3413036 RepID=UPI003BF0B68D